MPLPSFGGGMLASGKVAGVGVAVAPRLRADYHCDHLIGYVLFHKCHVL